MRGEDKNRERGPAKGWIAVRPLAPSRRRWGAAWCLAGFALLVALAPVSGGAEVKIGGPFELVDQNGTTRTDADFSGSYMLMYFGFTHCPDTCPTALLKMAQALEALGELDAAKAERVVPMFVSVDPERDTPEALRSYAENFHPRLVALTGAPRELDRLGRAYGVFFAKVPTGDPGEYLMDHTSFVYLIGPEGKYVRHFESDVSVDDLVGALRRDVVTLEVSGS
jgi:cytochrome oxidase Cu insertion factor (SCO1/SenC/PrrC family)